MHKIIPNTLAALDVPVGDLTETGLAALNVIRESINVLPAMVDYWLQ